MEKEFKIGEGILNALASYLAARPYAEVAQLIQALGSVANTAVVEEQQEEPASKKK